MICRNRWIPRRSWRSPRRDERGSAHSTSAPRAIAGGTDWGGGNSKKTPLFAPGDRPITNVIRTAPPSDYPDLAGRPCCKWAAPADHLDNRPGLADTGLAYTPQTRSGGRCLGAQRATVSLLQMDTCSKSISSLLPYGASTCPVPGLAAHAGKRRGRLGRLRERSTAPRPKWGGQVRTARGPRAQRAALHGKYLHDHGLGQNESHAPGAAAYMSVDRYRQTAWYSAGDRQSLWTCARYATLRRGFVIRRRERRAGERIPAGHGNPTALAHRVPVTLSVSPRC